MAVEDFTTYTEVDPSTTHITKDANTVTFTGLANNEDAYVYKDKDAAHFDGDFEHLVDVQCTSHVGNYALMFPYTLANLVDDFKGIDDAGGDALGSYFGDQAGTVRLNLLELIAGTSYEDLYTCAYNTPYYLKIKRDEAVGANGTLYCYIYDDEGRTNLVDTLTLTLHEKEDFRYVYATQTYNNGDARTMTGWVENLDLQEGWTGKIAGVTNPAKIAGVAVAGISKVKGVA